MKLYVRMAKMALGWQKCLFGGNVAFRVGAWIETLAIRGLTQVAPHTPYLVGSPTASVFHGIERAAAILFMWTITFWWLSITSLFDGYSSELCSEISVFSCNLFLAFKFASYG